MSAPGRHARPRAPRFRVLRWYLLPLPLAALVVVAMPWVAVRDVRQSHKAFKTLCDIMLRAYGRDQLGRAPAPRQRHLHAVK